MTPFKPDKIKDYKESETIGNIEKGSRREQILLLLLKGDQTKTSITKELKYKEKKSSWISQHVTWLKNNGYVDFQRLKGNYFDSYRLNLKIVFEYLERSKILLTEKEKNKLNILFKKFKEKGREKIALNYIMKGMGTISRSIIFSLLEYFVYQSPEKEFSNNLELIAKFEAILSFDLYEDPSILDEISNKIAERIEKISGNLNPVFFDSKNNSNYDSMVEFYAKKISDKNPNFKKDLEKINRLSDIFYLPRNKKIK
jgi:hypothetical protein